MTERPTAELAEKFWARVAKTDACWMWTGPVNHKGYGQLYDRGLRRSVRAHRLSYELAYGPIPPGLTIDHLCNVRRCVRPDHLAIATRGANALRGDGPAALNKRKTRCSRGHEFTPSNTYHSRGRRYCRECRRQDLRAARAVAPPIPKAPCPDCGTPITPSSLTRHRRRRHTAAREHSLAPTTDKGATR